MDLLVKCQNDHESNCELSHPSTLYVCNHTMNLPRMAPLHKTSKDRAHDLFYFFEVINFVCVRIFLEIVMLAENIKKQDTFISRKEEKKKRLFLKNNLKSVRGFLNPQCDRF